MVAPNLDDALAAARGDALRRGADAIIVAGGGDIYIQALPVATRLAITEVHKRVEGDAYFPAIDPLVWREVSRSEQQPAAEDEASFAFVDYERREYGGKAPAERGITARCKGRGGPL